MITSHRRLTIDNPYALYRWWPLCWSMDFCWLYPSERPVLLSKIQLLCQLLVSLTPLHRVASDAQSGTYTKSTLAGYRLDLYCMIPTCSCAIDLLVSILCCILFAAFTMLLKGTTLTILFSLSFASCRCTNTCLGRSGNTEIGLATLYNTEP